jgi:hypothetical protein
MHVSVYKIYGCCVSGGKWNRLKSQSIFSRNSFLDCRDPLILFLVLWLTAQVKVKVKVMTVGQSVLVSSTHLGLTTRFLFLSESCGFVDVGRSLWRENGSAVYNCYWSSPAQSFLGTSPTGLVTIFYSFRFESPPTWRARSPYLYPTGTRWPNYTPRHWVLFITFYDSQG